MTQINNITLGYSDSEDRIWLRLVLANGNESFLWLTRKLTLQVITAIEKLITQETSTNTFNNSSTDILKNEFFEKSISVFDPTPEPPAKNQIPEKCGLCHQIKITYTPTWQISFEMPNNINYQLNLDRDKIFKVLIALIRQSNKANWQDSYQPSWAR